MERDQIKYQFTSIDHRPVKGDSGLIDTATGTGRQPDHDHNRL